MNLDTILTQLYLIVGHMDGGLMFAILIIGLLALLFVPFGKKSGKLRWICHLGAIIVAVLLIISTVALEKYYEPALPGGTVFTINEDGTRTDHPIGRRKAPNVWFYSGHQPVIERDFGPFKTTEGVDAYATIGLRFTLTEPEKYVAWKKYQGGGRIEFETGFLKFLATPVTARTEGLKALLDADIDLPEERRLESATAIARAVLQEQYLDKRGIGVEVVKLQYGTYGKE